MWHLWAYETVKRYSSHTTFPSGGPAGACSHIPINPALEQLLEKEGPTHPSEEQGHPHPVPR